MTIDSERLPNVHPGEVLREEFLLPLRLSAYRLAKDLGVPQTRISQILVEKRGVTADTAVRLGRYFDTSPGFWLNLQNACDLEEVERLKAPEMAPIRRYLPVSEAASP